MGKGGSVKRYDALEPKSEQVGAIESGLGNLFLGGLQSIDPAEWAAGFSNAKDRSDKAIKQQDDLLGQLPGIFDKNSNIIDSLVNLANTGQVPQAALDMMNKTVNNGLQTGMGSMLNSLGNRGVLNSSITSKGINNLAGNAANAVAGNYLNLYNATGDTWSKALQGNLGNASSLISGANAYGQIPTQAYEQLYAPITGAYNFWKDAETIRHSRDAYDTVVKQGK